MPPRAPGAGADVSPPSSGSCWPRNKGLSKREATGIYLRSKSSSSGPTESGRSLSSARRRRRRPGVPMGRGRGTVTAPKKGCAVAAASMTATAVLRGAEILSPAALRVADSRSPLVFASCDLGHRAGFVPVRLNVALFAVPKVHGVRCARRVRWAGGNGLPDVLLDSPRPRGMQKAAWQGCDCSRSPVNPGTVPEAGAGKPPEAGVALAADSGQRQPCDSERPPSSPPRLGDTRTVSGPASPQAPPAGPHS